jgi:hypothetical protein
MPYETSSKKDGVLITERFGHSLNLSMVGVAFALLFGNTADLSGKTP